MQIVLIFLILKSIIYSGDIKLHKNSSAILIWFEFEDDIQFCENYATSFEVSVDIKLSQRIIKSLNLQKRVWRSYTTNKFSHYKHALFNFYFKMRFNFTWTSNHLNYMLLMKMKAKCKLVVMAFVIIDNASRTLSGF